MCMSAATVAAMIDRDSGELRRRRLSGRAAEVAEFVAGLAGPVARRMRRGRRGSRWRAGLQAAGVDCLVCAPGLIPRGPTDRVKTDRRDAERLVRLLIAGELHRGRVPTLEAEGAARPGARARGSARRSDECAPSRWPSCCCAMTCASRARSATGLRPHLRWLSTVRFEQPGTQAAFDDYRGAVEALIDPPRRARGRDRRALLPLSPWAQTARRLMCLRGIDTLDRGRAVRRGRRLRPVRPPRAADELSRRRALRALLGRPGAGRARSPSPAASTPVGCWSRRPGTTASRPASAAPLRRRQAGADPRSIALSWKTQRRLHRVWSRMEAARQAPHASSPSPRRASSPGSAGRSPPH